MTTCPSRGTRTKMEPVYYSMGTGFKEVTIENGCQNPMTNLLECIGEDCCYHFKFLNLIDTMTKRLENG